MQTPNEHDTHERFTRLLLEHEPVLLRSILTVIPNRADAHEIIQETAVALWRQFETYDPQRPFVNWAMGFSRIETRRFLARQRRRAQLSEKAAAALEIEMELKESEDSRDAIERHLTTCLGKLPERQRHTIKGYYHENRSPEWLADQQGRSVDAIYKALQRIRRDLQACIEAQRRREGLI